MPDWQALLGEFHFLRPWWLAAIAVGALLAWSWRRVRTSSGNWEQVLHPALLPWLLSSDKGQRRSLSMAIFLLWLIASLALAGPTWQRQPQPVQRDESALIVLFDLSPSMLSQDLKPDRITRARLKAIDFLNQRKEGLAGLVVYAADAHAVAPLTDDNRTLINLIPDLHPSIMPERGSNTESAVRIAIELMHGAGYRKGDLLLITDGVASDAIGEVDRILRGESGFRLLVLGVGTGKGAPIPLADSGFAKDRRGGIVIARLEAAALRKLAERHRGVFSPLTADDRDIALLANRGFQLYTEQYRELDRTFDVWQDMGAWLACLLLPLLIPAFRRGRMCSILLGFICLSLMSPQQAQALTWRDLWLTRDQQGARAMEKGEVEDAAKLFENPSWQGAAHYQSGNYKAAAEGFAKDDTADGFYNLGNALAGQGRIDEAISAYDEALKRDGNLADAEYNREKLEQLKNQQGGSGGQDKPGNQNQSGEQNPSDNKDQKLQRNNGGLGQQSTRDSSVDEPSDQINRNERNSTSDQAKPNRSAQQSSTSNDSSDAESKQSQSHQPSGDSKQQDESRQHEQTTQTRASEEKPRVIDGGKPKQSTNPQLGEQSDSEEDQTMQQMLRLVPEDPGGLLRNKFRYQARQRALERRRGLRASPDQADNERW